MKLIIAGYKRKRGSNDVVHLFWSQFTPEQNERVLVIRKQYSGLCYLHAPVVLEHYLIAIATGCERPSIIDIGKYQKFLLTGDKLLDFLLKNKGGNSQKTFKDLCNLNDCDTVRYMIPDMSRTHMVKYAKLCSIV